MTNTYKKEIDKLNHDLVKELQFCISIQDKDKAISTFLEIERETRQNYNRLVESYKYSTTKGSCHCQNQLFRIMKHIYMK
jgi:hypothetical protein